MCSYLFLYLPQKQIVWNIIREAFKKDDIECGHFPQGGELDNPNLILSSKVWNFGGE